MGCGCRDKKTGRTSIARFFCSICGTKVTGPAGKMPKIGTKIVCPRCGKTYEKMKALEAANQEVKK